MKQRVDDLIDTLAKHSDEMAALQTTGILDGYDDQLLG